MAFSRNTAVGLLVLTVLVAGCASQISKEELTQKLAASAGTLKTYKFDMNIKMDTDVVVKGVKTSGTTTMTMIGDADDAQRRLKADTTINLPGSPQLLLKTYIIDDTMYLKSGGFWSRQALTDESRKDQDQYQNALDLLNSGPVEIIGEEAVNGKPHIVVKVTPDLQKLLDKTLGSSGASYPQGLSPKDMIKSFTVKMWVEKDTFVIGKSMITVGMEVEDKATSTAVKIDMTLDMKLYDHNKPVTIELPVEAADATEISSFG